MNRRVRDPCRREGPASGTVVTKGKSWPPEAETKEGEESRRSQTDGVRPP